MSITAEKYINKIAHPRVTRLNVIANDRRERGNLNLLFLMGLPRRFAPRNDNVRKGTLLYSITLGPFALIQSCSFVLYIKS